LYPSVLGSSGKLVNIDFIVKKNVMHTLHLASLRDAQLVAFKGAPAPQVGLQAPGSRDAAHAASRDFVVALATERAADPAFCLLWQALVAASASPQKIYQTPAFFKFLQESRKPGERLELVTVVRLSDAAIVGVVPVRVSKQDLNFNVGPLMLHSAKVEMISLLGSIPAVPGGSAVADYLANQMLALFPGAKAVFMQALPAKSDHWNDLNEGVADSMLSTSLMGPWRDCYTMPLPPTFDAYLEKFSAKKRYNLNRQIRQLTEQVGTLELERIERAEQVPAMMHALTALVTSEEQKSILSETTFTRLAGQGLLLSYVLRAGDQVLAAVIGTRSPDTLHIHNIFVEKKHLAVSVGTSAMHLTIKDLTGLGGLTSIDFGYGTPNNEFRSSHVVETRAQVLLFDRSKSISLLFFAHRHFTALSEGAICVVKSLRKRLQALRKAQPA
jgi:CelD/BcsL family acetyltransferase involved in cellulose biosynthesis